MTLDKNALQAARDALWKNRITSNLSGAITAYLSTIKRLEQELHTVPSGWKLVPCEPTRAMQIAGRDALLDGDDAHAVYLTMLDASPAPPPYQPPAREAKPAEPGGATYLDDWHEDPDMGAR